MTALLEVKGLKTHFFTRAGVAKAVDGVDFTLNEGEVMGLVGESGSGKSVTSFSILGLIDPPGRVVEGEILFRGEELRTASEARLRALRGKDIAMIFQDPMMTLTPVLRIETQMVETILAHEKVSKKAARARAIDVLGRVGISAPETRIGAYPHQFSGGMRQRVAIAIALLHQPALILADEPTTALDVTIQGQIISEMQKLVAETGTAMIWVSHDLAVVETIADRVAVMYAGRIVESGPAGAVIGTPSHPYTEGLLNSIPSRTTPGRKLNQIPGMAPSVVSLPEGCAFAPRCRYAAEICRAAPPLAATGPERWARCALPLREGVTT
ncbi:ABC transporter ATP-binding protein [Oceanicola sp. 502str15]|uniref:ABC transporter ATP-binding protein n=1 Tax=Oceanicola sp. 502str15 TaxID=2696061 RepID=UPI002095B628|nr:ABC transporter ATP-binding protein [Oceanicola sp. 502str15]MCO6382686.1 ATP-binding cassette domain-containing protein [Oceanicola sp. 502str15]